MTRKLSLLCAIAVLAAGTLVRAAESVRIVPITSGDEVVVTVELADAYTTEVREAISSGLRTTFTYTVELRLDVPVWIDRTIATAVVSNTVQYDNLTRRHNVQRTLDGRVEQARVTEDESIVRQSMTTFERLPLFRTSSLEPNREYYVRVRATARPSNGSLFWPWASGPTGQTKFTFIP